MAGLALEAELRSERGPRPENEDSVFASPRLVAVADGVGGAAAGEVASRVAVHALAEVEKCWLTSDLGDALTEAVLRGNDRIGFIAECRPHMSGMSTTLTAVALDDDGTYVVANIGDSRTYLFRDGVLSRLTRDDSYVQSLIDRGALSEADARRHPRRSLVLHALDGLPERTPALATIEARAGDRLLLCSDGLSDYVDDDALAAVLPLRSRSACAERLVAAALAAGAGDNVSLVVADVVPRRDGAELWRR